MKRLLMLMTGLAAAIGMMAQEADYSKLTGLARRAAREAASPARRAAAEKRSLTAFVQLRDDAAADVLEQYGCRRHAQMGDIAIASIPLSRLAALSRQPAVRRIEASGQAQALMDTVPRVSNILPAYKATPQHQAFTGQGVVVGIVDVGFDLTHPNFYSDAQQTRYRIGAFWDQLSTDTIGSPLAVGRDYTGADAITAIGRSTDSGILTHGTHTMGIAAGSGYDTPYRGVAFGSELCVVNNAVTNDTVLIAPDDRYRYTTATDALAFKYVFDYADRVGKPCVASFSEGYSLELNREDSLFAAFMDHLNGPGHIIVASAGNENVERAYAVKPRGTEQAGAFVRSFHHEALYNIRSDRPVSIVLHAYANGGGTPSHTLRYAADDARLDSLLTDTLFVNADTCAITLCRYPSVVNTADTVYELTLTGNRTLDFLPHMALVVEGADAEAELWGNSTNALTSRATDPRWNAAQGGHNILGPGCFPSVICVGATSHRLGFTNQQGTYCDYSSGQHQGLRMSQSSTGPAINGLMKPDVTAPGYCVVSSFSSYYMESNPEDSRSLVATSTQDGRTYGWAAQSGTSMSAPVVAGAIALWMEACPTLTREQAMGVLSRTSSHPDTSLSYPNQEYGYGDIDAYAGLLDLLGVSALREVSTHWPAAVSVRPTAQGLSISFRKTPDKPVSISVYSLTGHVVAQTTLNAMQGQEARMVLPALAAGVYVVQLTSPDAALMGSVLVRI